MHGDPRLIGTGCIVLGAVFVIVGIVDLMGIGDPIHISGPFPSFNEWVLDTFGHTGVRVLMAVFWWAFGAFSLRYGWRAVVSRELP